MREDNFFNSNNDIYGNGLNSDKSEFNNNVNGNSEINSNDVNENNSLNSNIVNSDYKENNNNYVNNYYSEINSNSVNDNNNEIINNEFANESPIEVVNTSNSNDFNMSSFNMYDSNEESNANDSINEPKIIEESELEQVKNDESAYQPNFVFTDEKNVKGPKKKKARKFFKKVAGLVAAAAVFGVIAGGSFQFVNQGGFQKKDTTIESNQGDKIATTDNDDQSSDTIATSTGKPTVMDVSTVVENAMPAIVSINSSSTQTEYDFFGRVYENEVSGSGSGIIIGQNDNEILIATNNHVVNGATAIEIVFDDDTKAIAKLKGAEPSSDLAVVSVDINDLTKETRSHIKIATLGNSDEVKTGELAIAIGNALGYGQSVTVGYISALNREVSVEDTTLNLLQTDAAINPGNSGGALLNASGEVIGINSVKYADTSVEGIGYAIPISEAIPIINDLMNREDLDASESAYLGIQPKTVDESYSQAFNMPVGVYVLSVVEGSPAEKAGLQQGDIITSINGKKIKDASELQSYLSYTRAGSKVEFKVSVLENGEYVENTLEVTLGNRPASSK